MSFVIAIVQALVIMALAPLVSGMARVIRAKMHTRKGPSIFQDYYDIAKLFKRQDVHPADSSFIHRITPAVYLGVMLVLAMGIRSFAVPIFLGLLGGITGIFAAAKGFGLLWPYALMQAGMNANRSTDMLAGQYALFFFSCVLWLAAMFALAYLLLQKRDVKA